MRLSYENNMPQFNDLKACIASFRYYVLENRGDKTHPCFISL